MVMVVGTLTVWVVVSVVLTRVIVALWPTEVAVTDPATGPLLSGYNLPGPPRPDKTPGDCGCQKFLRMTPFPVVLSLTSVRIAPRPVVPTGDSCWASAAWTPLLLISVVTVLRTLFRLPTLGALQTDCANTSLRRTDIVPCPKITTLNVPGLLTSLNCFRGVTSLVTLVIRRLARAAEKMKVGVLTLSLVTRGVSG